jgi:hypothetical protein
MDLAQKFEAPCSSNIISISSLEVGRKYPIVLANRATTRFGPTILLSLQESVDRMGKIFLPSRYSSVFSDTDIEDVNCQKVSPHFMYQGKSETTKAYDLTIVKEREVWTFFSLSRFTDGSRDTLAEVTSCHLLKVNQMVIDVLYLIFQAERVTTRLGTTVSLHLRDSRDPRKIYFLCLPKRFGKAFTDRNIEEINADRVWLSLTYKGHDPITKMHILEICL